jgi:flagellar basal body rod protein FlgC
VADAILIARSGLADTLYRLDKAAVNVVKATAPVQARPRDGAPVTGATGAPSGSSGDVATAFLDLMSAEMSFRANVEVLKTQAEMVRSLYDALD